MIIFKFSDVILNNFTSPGKALSCFLLLKTKCFFFFVLELIRPFLARLFEYFDKAPIFSTSRWLVFEFLAEQFYKNQKLIQ